MAKYLQFIEESYRRPVLFAGLLHVIVLLVVFFSFNFTSNWQATFDERKGTVITAEAVNLNAIQKANQLIRAQKLAAERKRQAEIAAKKRKAEEALQKLQKQQQEEAARLAAKRAAAEKAEQARLEKQRLQALAKQQQQELEKKIAQETAKQAQIKEKQQADVLKKKQALAKAQQADALKDLQQQMQEEQQALSAARDKQVQTIVTHYMGLIQETVESHWNKPPSADPNLKCKLVVILAANGAVLNVSVFKTSGDDALDRSAVAAVYNAEPLPIPDDASVFNHYFRKFTITT